MKWMLLVIFWALIGIWSVQANEDGINYVGAGFVPMREVSDRSTAADWAVGTTVITLTLPTEHYSSGVLVVNDHGSQIIYVQADRDTAFNIDNSAGSTVAGSADMDLGTTIAGLAIGDIIVLDEGDGNDGVYFIESISGDIVTFTVALTVTNAGDQDYKIQSFPLLAGENLTFEIGTKTISLLGSGAATDFRLMVTYQKDLRQ